VVLLMVSQMTQKADLPQIPEKLYFTISEVSTLCDVKPHVLRYWEQEFPQLSPVKRRGNRRYYQRNDVLLIREIRRLLYNQGFTIGGAVQKLSSPENKSSNEQNIDLVKQIRRELEEVLKSLRR
jgi:DNA-binding transcriptional MerR regulator